MDSRILRLSALAFGLVAACASRSNDWQGDDGDDAETRDDQGADDGNGPDACERGIRRMVEIYESCGVHVGSDSGSETPECTDALAAQIGCFVSCIESTDCDVIAGDIDSSDPEDLERLNEYGQCIATCA